MKKAFFLLFVLVGILNLQAQLTCTGSMSVTVTGSTSGIPLAGTTAVTSNFNGFGVSCNLASTGNNSNGQITTTASGGTTPYSYVNNGGTSQSSNVFGSLLGTAGAGTAYTVVVTDANGCAVTTTAVNVIAPPSLLAGTCTLANDPCQLNAGSIKVEAQGGVMPCGVTWTATAVAPFTGTPAGSPAGTSQPITTNNGSVTYTGLSGNSNYQFVVTDTNGCVVQ